MTQQPAGPNVRPVAFLVENYGFTLTVAADGPKWAITGVAIDLVTQIAKYGAPVLRDQRWDTPEEAEAVAVKLLALGAQFAQGVAALVPPAAPTGG